MSDRGCCRGYSYNELDEEDRAEVDEIVSGLRDQMLTAFTDVFGEEWAQP